MDPEKEFFTLLRVQHGVGRVHQGTELGVPTHRINQMRRGGQLRSCAHGIVAAAGAPETDAFRRMLGVLIGGYGSKAGTNAAIVDVTAAMAHDMADGPKEPIHVVTTRRIRPRTGFVFHFTSRLPADETVMVDGIPTTDPLRTWLDICDSWPRRGKSIFYRGIRNHHFTPVDALARIEKESCQGRGGLALARVMAEAASPGAERAKSRKEEEVFNWILEAGLPLPERNVYVPSSFGFDYEVDFLYRVGRKIVIDVSLHWLHALDPDVYFKDVRKKDDLENQGYKFIVVTDDTRRSEFLAQLERELNRFSHAPNDGIAQ